MNIYAIVLAAGKGTRMKSDLPKVAHEVLYKPMIKHVCDELKKIDVTQTIVVVGHKAEVVKNIMQDEVTYVMQEEQLGTGHAVKMAYDLLKDKEGITLVLNGDAPLIRKETLEALIKTHVDNENKATLMSAHCDTKFPFGRIVRNEQGNVLGIVEAKDATPEQLQITEMNTGEYCFDNQLLFDALTKVNNNNAQNEYYLTDVIEILGKANYK